MVKFVGFNYSVNNSNLYELNGYKPVSNDSPTQYNISSKFKNGVLKIEVSQNNGWPKYNLNKIQVSESKADKIFQKPGFEKKVFKGDDLIKGSTQSDQLFGFKGDDKIVGFTGNDTLYGGGGSDTLSGGDGNDWLYGDQANDTLDGGTGYNYLTGGAGKDTFAFTSTLGYGNVSEIADFKHKQDKFQLSKKVFDGLSGKGTLKSSNFSTLEDYTGDSRTVVYDEDTGRVYYSKYGGGLSNAYEFARVKWGTDLDNKDFLVA